MKLIINASNLVTTGVIQVTVSFLYECKKSSINDYHIFVSKNLAREIKQDTFPSNFTFYEFNKHPFFYISPFSKNYYKVLEGKINPDCVFTVFGPSWWTPSTSHLQGYALAHYLYRESPLFGVIPFYKKLKIKALSILHKFLLKKNGQYFVCETNNVAKRLKLFLNQASISIYTVTNTYNNYFNNFIPKAKYFLPSKSANEFRLVILSSFVSHKNLTILNKVIPLLNSIASDKKIVFILTVAEAALEKNISQEAMKNIVNLGSVPVALCPQIYHECDALFFPSLMECFSANYPEAMKMQKPILTSDLVFAREICETAALYFNPLDPQDIVEKILLLIDNKRLQEDLIEKGINRLASFDTSESRALKYLEICERISKNKKSLVST